MDLSTLPRTVRWRIQLGVLSEPGAEDVSDILPTFSTLELLAAIYQSNKHSLNTLHIRYQALVEKYYPATPNENDDDDDDNEEKGNEEEDHTNHHNKNHNHPNHTEISSSMMEEIEESETAGPANGVAITTTSTSMKMDMDPLTAMVLEQQAEETRKAELLLKYKKERALRKRGITADHHHGGGEAGGDESESSGIDRASLMIIDKDLKRLPHPTSKDNGAASGTLTPKEEQRLAHLKELLYVYAHEHPHMGYRQGMHEIASYLWYALETESQQFANHPLYESSILLPSCFAMLEHTLNELQLAYDASGEQALQRMSHAILSKIHQNDTVLFQILTTSPHIPPPPIYCTRWVRLLFSREVVGCENVFALWDVFFQRSKDMMQVLQVTSAARILLLRDALLQDDHNHLDLLMNVPPLQDIRPLTDLVQLLMDQKPTDRPIRFHRPKHTPNTPQQQSQVPPQHLSNYPQPLQQQQQQQPSLLQSPTAKELNPLMGPSFFAYAQTPPSAKDSPAIPRSSNMHHTASTNFSFSKMRQTLNQKGESIRKKIITATNEWSREASGGSQPQSLLQPQQQQLLHQQPYSVNYYGSATTAASGPSPLNTTPLRGSIVHTEPGAFMDPLSSSSAPMHSVNNNGGSPNHLTLQPPSPRKHQHARWSHLLKERIMVVQQFLMTVESRSPSHTNNSLFESDDDDENDHAAATTTMKTKLVPPEVWEAMADIQRIQQELHNYSINMT